MKTIRHPIDLAMVGRVQPGTWWSWDPAWSAAEALGKIAPGTPSAGEVIEVLTEVERTGHPYRRESAARALGKFGPAAVGAVPALISVIRENAATKAIFGDGSSAAIALGKIAPGTPLAEEAVSCLTEALQARSEYTRESRDRGSAAIRAEGCQFRPAPPRARQRRAP